MNRDYGDFLFDILDSIDQTALFTDGITFEEFARDIKTVNAVIRSLEVLGEAVKNLPDGIRNHAPDVPWKRMAGMRDKLIHDYFGVDLAIIWAVVQEELPPLREPISLLAREIYPEDNLL